MNSLFKAISVLSFLISGVFSVNALASAGTLQVYCESASGATRASLSFVGTEALGTMTLNDRTLDISGSYIVKPAGSFCVHSDVTILSVYTNTNPTFGLKSIQGNNCGGTNGDFVIVNGTQEVAKCAFSQN